MAYLLQNDRAGLPGSDTVAVSATISTDAADEEDTSSDQQGLSN
jgi:hypothetical protein